jgi:phage-related protein
MAAVSRLANLQRTTYSIHYYNQRVLDEILNWPAGIRSDYARLVNLLVDRGPVLGMPHCRLLGGGIFEIRASGAEGIGRALYCFCPGQCVVVLHALVKRTEKIPMADMRLARRRIKEVRNG